MKRALFVLLFITVGLTAVFISQIHADKTKEAAVTISDNQLAFRYTTTYGVTEEPYIIDTIHHNGPHGVIVDTDDNLWITEVGGNRVLKFNSSGVYQSMLGQTGIGRGWGIYLVQPISTAVDSNGNAWVSDQATHRLKQYDNTGDLIMALGEEWASGSDNAHFNRPSGVAVDSSNNVYVADKNNHRKLL